MDKQIKEVHFYMKLSIEDKIRIYEDKRQTGASYMHIAKKYKSSVNVVQYMIRLIELLYEILYRLD